MYGRAGHISAQFFGALYFMNLFFGFILAMGNRPVGNGRLYMCISHVWTLIMMQVILNCLRLQITLTVMQIHDIYPYHAHRHAMQK